MAKLTNVNVVAERIEYNGANYVKTDGAAQAGDIVRMDVDGHDDYLPQGAFFEVVTQDDGDTGIIDEEGDDITVDDDFTLFRRVADAEPSPKPLPTSLPGDYVIHDGKVYVKEARKAEVGEKVVITQSCWDRRKVGSVVTAVRMGGWAPIADDGISLFQTDENDYRVLVPTDTVTIDGAEYTLEKRSDSGCIERGAKFIVVSNNHETEDVSIGDIKTNNYAGGIGYDFGRGVVYYDDALLLAPKTSATTSQHCDDSASRYREVKRKANVGERIRIVELFPGESRYNVGDEFIADKVDDEGLVTVRKLGSRIIAKFEYVVLEAQSSLAVGLTVGDYVKVVKHGGGHDYEIGDIVKVTRISDILYAETLFYGDVVSTGRSGNCLSTKQTVRATDEEVAAAQRNVTLQIGSYARVVAESHPQNGNIVKIVNTTYDEYYPYDTETLDGEVGGCYREDQLEPVTPAEVDAARKAYDVSVRQTEEAADTERKWSAIGRKVNEYKVGDIVEATAASAGYGRVIYVLEPEKRYRVKYKTEHGVCSEPVRIIRLVAPVESLFTKE